MKIEGLSQEVKDKVKQLLDTAPADQKAEKERAMMLNLRNSLDSAISHRKKRNFMRDSRILSSL